MQTYLNNISAQGSILIIVDSKHEAIARSTNNLPTVKVVTARYMTAFDVLNADCLVIEQTALDTLHTWLGGAKS